jgi:uncharacterized protein YndB with AHSA1/START domain
MNEPWQSDSLTTEAGRNVLTVRREFARSCTEVWEALTRPAVLSRWFPFDVGVDLRAGGVITFGVPGGDVSQTTGTVTDVEEPRLFAFTWGSELFRWTVAPAGDGAALTLEQTFDDRAGAPGFAAGWDLCMAALGQVMAGREPAAGRDRGQRHERYVRHFGLAAGTAGTLPGGRRTVRFERQLVRHAERVWEVLSAGIEPVPGLPVPVGFTARGVPAGHVTEVRPPHALRYESGDEESVAWEFGAGTGYGARLVLVQTGPASFDTGAALAAWQEALDALAGQLLDA